MIVIQNFSHFKFGNKQNENMVLKRQPHCIIDDQNLLHRKFSNGNFTAGKG